MQVDVHLSHVRLPYATRLNVCWELARPVAPILANSPRTLPNKLVISEFTRGRLYVLADGIRRCKG